jgi:hypothetical protein
MLQVQRASNNRAARLRTEKRDHVCCVFQGREVKTMPDKITPSTLAVGTVQKFINRYAGAARNIAEDITDGQYDADEFASVLHGYADSSLIQIATEAVNAAFRAGRAEGLNEVTPEIERSGKEVEWIRSSVMEAGTCSSCESADGESLDGPDDDLTEIHEGPPDTCLCIPVADISSEAA